jgi:hypothetical protein
MAPALASVTKLRTEQHRIDTEDLPFPRIDLDDAMTLIIAAETTTSRELQRTEWRQYLLRSLTQLGGALRFIGDPDTATPSSRATLRGHLERQQCKQFRDGLRLAPALQPEPIKRTDMVTRTSLRVAVKRIVLAACGVICEDIAVVAPRVIEAQRFLVQIPREIRVDVYLHIADHVSISMPLCGDALFLSEADAERLQEYADRVTELNVTMPRFIPVEEFEQDTYALGA